MNGRRAKTSPIRFLVVSLTVVAALCVALLSFLAFYMNRRNTETINSVGSFYMSEMSQQSAKTCQSALRLRLDQVHDLAEAVGPGDGRTPEELYRLLSYNASASFLSVSLWAEDGHHEVVSGPRVDVVDPEPFLASLNAGEDKAAVGTAADGQSVILLGVSARYPMSGGGNSCALVAAIPASYLDGFIPLNEDNGEFYSIIIRRDGTYIISPSDATRENYFDRVRDTYEVSGGDAEAFIQRLVDGMDDPADYTSEFTIDGKRQHLYCTNLAYSEWHLLTFTSYGTLDSAISRLSRQWSVMIFSVCAALLVALGAVFLMFFRMIRQQMADLDTARREAEKANKAKSEFLSNMSHDIRTPMNAIVGMTAIATANMEDPAQVQNCLRKITLSSKHLLGLINDVLDMSKIESGKMTLNMDQVSLREVMDSIVNIVRPQIRAKRQKFDVSIHDISSENVCGDGVRLNQILINLLGNAVKFTPEEGSIRVSLSQSDSPQGDGYVRTLIVVADSGIGMSPEFQAKIFDSFAREDSTRVQKTEGTGLGMAITKYIVDAMGGTISVKSELGKGSEFRVVLDLPRAQIQEADMVLPDWNMLLVDDDQSLCESTVKNLASIGVKADWALDAESAIPMVDEHCRRGDGYHIILLDWKLPGMDGITAAREIRSRCGDETPILLISAYDWDEIQEEAVSAGITGFIAKPLFKSTLFYGLRPFAGSAAPAPGKKTMDLRGRRVLVAEDNDLNWEIANDLLTEELGLTLEWAENGQVCAERFRLSSPGWYDAILMDIRMPVMTGYEATAAIRAMERPDAATIPIIAMTADAFAEDIKKCLDCGMNAHVAKPIDVGEVYRQLDKFIQK
ncbi:MAG: response regulator [Oscillospiraceae bacterium]|jgi:two-component system sensor histidine kinase/response regulator|nr:response regulator [Oscillospiraceae bacterium]